jgi:hypothetical protein
MMSNLSEVSGKTLEEDSMTSRIGRGCGQGRNDRNLNLREGSLIRPHSLSDIPNAEPCLTYHSEQMLRSSNS